CSSPGGHRTTALCSTQRAVSGGCWKIFCMGNSGGRGTVVIQIGKQEEGMLKAPGGAESTLQTPSVTTYPQRAHAGSYT
ncbi:hypothetical protein P7K49_002473, partial [Saguinus oedipus]